MDKLKIFMGMCGRLKNGYESSGRGESRWAQSLSRCFVEAGHDVVMAPDAEMAEWGTCKPSSNARLMQAGQKIQLDKEHFDIAIYTSWQTEKPEAKYIHADKYVWGVMSWKHEIMKDGFFNDNEYVARWVRQDVPVIPYPINFKDRCKLLAQPFGREFGSSKFDNKRIAWVAKEAFLSTTRMDLSEASKRHLFAAVDACKETGAQLAIFSCHELMPQDVPRVVEMGIANKLAEIKDQLIMYPDLPVKEYQKELQKCSVTIPVSFAGSVQESIFGGLVPLLYRDHMFSDHQWIKGVVEELTDNCISRAQSDDDTKDLLGHDRMVEILTKLLSDRDYFNEYLYRLRPMVADNLDSNVLNQFNDIIKHKPRGN